jgi:cytoskeletal protein CcmA (bactofilin family)
MPRATHILLGFVLGLSGLATTADAWAQRFGRTEIIREASPDDLYVAGREVELLAPVSGDAVVAGGSVIIVGDVSEDVIAAGRRVTVSGAVGDDARLAGRSVTLAGSVAGHAVIAGRRVSIDEGSRIAGWAWIRGTRVVIDGQVGGDLRVRGSVIELNGQVDGNADLTARFIRIGDDAIINGDLTWRAQRANISDSAVIEGEVIEGESRRRRGRGRGVFRTLFAVIAVIVAAGVLYSVFRPWCDECAATLKSRPWATLLTGLAVVAATPLAVGLLFATGIGALLAVVLLLAYVLALLLGSLSGVVALARLGLSRFRADAPAKLWLAWSAIAIVSIVVGAAYVVRPLGMVVGTLVMLLGLGTLALNAYSSFRVSRA